MHREFDAMKEAVAGDQEVALELEEHLGMVGLGIRLEKGLGVRFGSVCFFFRHDLHSGIHANCCCRRTTFYTSSAFCAQHSTDRSCSSFHLPSYEIHGSFVALPCHHVACVQLSWSTTTPAHEICSPTPERVMVQFRQMMQRRLLLRRYEVLLGGGCCLPKTYCPPRLLILNLRGGR